MTNGQPKPILTLLEKTLAGVRAEITQVGRKVEGLIALDAPNRVRRSRCKVDYTIPKSWTDDENEAALRLAAHWFRDIGGFQTVCKRHVCHIVARLKEEISEREMHFAIKAYATSPWHVEKKSWVAMTRFFVSDMVSQWIDKSDDLHRERELELEAKRIEAEQRHQKNERARLKYQRDHATEIARRKKLSRVRCADQAKKQADKNESPKANRIKTIWDANELLPKSHRWVIPVLVSNRTKADVRSKAQAMLEETTRLIWPKLTDALRSQVNSLVQCEVYRRTGSFPQQSSRPSNNHLRALIKVAQQQASRIKPVGNAHTMSKIMSEASK